MANRLEVDWPEEEITDCLLLEVFQHVAKQLTGLVLQSHADGRVLILTDKDRVVKHVLYNINENNWGCFCPGALDGECAASTYARVRLMKDLEDE